jgi:hypothetical protein
MVELVLIVCLAGTPDSCSATRPDFQEAMSVTACMLQGQIVAIDWLEHHPDYELKGWRCAMPAA